MQSVISSSSIRDLWGDRRGLLLILWLTLHLMLAFLSWSLRICCLSESLRILTPKPSLPFCELVSMPVPDDSCMQRWFSLAGLSWIPSCYAWGTQAPVQLLRHQFPSSSTGDEFNFRQNICNSFLPVILLLGCLQGKKEMIFQQKLFVKVLFHCQNDQSGQGLASQFWLLESALSVGLSWLRVFLW